MEATKPDCWASRVRSLALQRESGKPKIFVGRTRPAWTCCGIWRSGRTTRCRTGKMALLKRRPGRDRSGVPNGGIAVASLQAKAAKAVFAGKLGQFFQLGNQQLIWNQRLMGDRIPLPPPCRGSVGWRSADFPVCWRSSVGRASDL